MEISISNVGYEDLSSFEEAQGIMLLSPFRNARFIYIVVSHVGFCSLPSLGHTNGNEQVVRLYISNFTITNSKIQNLNLNLIKVATLRPR